MHATLSFEGGGVHEEDSGSPVRTAYNPGLIEIPFADLDKLGRHSMPM